MALFRFKACRKCRGDLVLDEGDWLCLQCGTYYYTGLYHLPAFIPSDIGRQIEPEFTPPGQEKTMTPEPPPVSHNEVRLHPRGPAIGPIASGIVAATETGTVAR